MDGAVVVATDVSDAAFTIIASSSVPAEEEEEEEVAEGSGSYGVSPVTGELEEISVVEVGDYVRGVSFSTVYYIGADMKRHPFMDKQTYMTYESDFSNVITVTNATLPTLTMGQPVLPKSGVVLAKIISNNRVYAINTAGDGSIELRWITTEAVALANYGSRWADYVIDVPVTLYPKFELGSDIKTDEDLGSSSMRTRMEVNR